VATKQEILSRIRVALGREAGSAPVPLAPFVTSARPVSPEDPTQRFCSEFQRAGGRVTRINSSQEVENYLDPLLPRDSSAPVAVSDARVLKDLKIREWLCTRGISLVPSFRESLENSARAEDASTANGGGLDPREDYKRALLGASVGITAADYAIADTGTLVLISGAEQHRIHVCFLTVDQILPNLTELIERVHIEAYSKEAPSQAMTFITGPSRTADIELSLTLGVHGPRELHLLLMQRQSK
jgi:L-lactate dehydrogenase complex protein LldG